MEKLTAPIILSLCSTQFTRRVSCIIPTFLAYKHNIFADKLHCTYSNMTESSALVKIRSNCTYPVATQHHLGLLASDEAPLVWSDDTGVRCSATCRHCCAHIRTTLCTPRQMFYFLHSRTLSFVYSLFPLWVGVSIRILKLCYCSQHSTAHVYSSRLYNTAICLG